MGISSEGGEEVLWTERKESGDQTGPGKVLHIWWATLRIHVRLIMLWEDLEGADGEGGGRGDRDGEDMWTQGLFISMYDKINYKKKKKD